MSDDEYEDNLDRSTYLEVLKNPKYNTKKKIYDEDSSDEDSSNKKNTYKIPVKEKIVNDPCIVGELNINDMYNTFSDQRKKEEKPYIDMAAWAYNEKYICENNKNKTFIPDKTKSRVILCDEMKNIAMGCRNDIKIKKDIKEKEAEEEAKRQSAEEAEKISKEKVLKELTFQNAWNSISTCQLDSKKIKPEKLTEIANALKDPEIHTFNNENNTYIIPDGQFDELIKKLNQNYTITDASGLPQNYTIMYTSGLKQEDINRHKKERTDFKAKNSKIFSSKLSTLWKRGGIKTRKYKKENKGNKYKSKKYRKNNKTKKCNSNKCKSNKCKSRKRNYK
jgi:hypothetical protein